MAPKVFITGITGYIAGDAFVALYEKHPEYEYTALVRTEEKAKQVTSRYPSVKIVIGDLDGSDLIKEQAAKNDIVLRWYPIPCCRDAFVRLTNQDAADASDHEGAARAIAAGLLEGHSKSSPGFWLHTGGTGILTYEDSRNDRLGEESDKIYDDLDKIEELTCLPDEAFHRNVDKIVLDATTEHSDIIKATIVCPPTIYGRGRGPVSGRGRQVYEMAKLILTGKYIPIIGAGKTMWNNVHIEDLSDVYVLLVEAAVRRDLSDELWGPKGYLLIENGEHVWSDIARRMGKEAKNLGYVGSLDERALSKEAALDQAGFEAVSWGLNSRGRGLRAKKFLGWKPKQHSLEAEVPKIVQQEHQMLLA